MWDGIYQKEKCFFLDMENMFESVHPGEIYGISAAVGAKKVGTCTDEMLTPKIIQTAQNNTLRYILLYDSTKTIKGYW